MNQPLRVTEAGQLSSGANARYSARRRPAALPADGLHRRSASGPCPRTGRSVPSVACAVGQILHEAEIGPESCRTGPAWRQFLTAQARGIPAVGFLHVDTVLLLRASTP